VSSAEQPATIASSQSGPLQKTLLDPVAAGDIFGPLWGRVGANGLILTGTYARVFDEKQRIAFPKLVREAMGDPKELFLTPANDGALAIYGNEAFARLAARLDDGSPTRADVRAFRRLFFSQAERIELDAQGRIRVPPALAQSAGLSKEVVLVGVQDHLELWDKLRWEQYFSQRAPEYDQFAERAFEPRGS
jgi:MraZ protein